jgi:citrate lyase subunit beta/citryl-CoA lyase
MLFVPGDRPERFAKAEASGADAVIFDLEDAVVATMRPRARVEISNYLKQSERSVPLWVRINPVDTPDALPDIAAVAFARPDGILLPKARNGDDVRRLDHWLEVLETAHGFDVGSIKVIPLITESAAAVLSAATFAPAPARVIGLTWGAEDLAADLGSLGNKTEAGEYEPPYVVASTMCLYAAAAAGVAAIETVDTEVRDLLAVERRARASRRAGYTAKLAIHPAQIAAIHAAFTPSPEEVAWAQRVLAAFHAAPGKGSLTLDGRLLDRPHVRLAERLLAAVPHRGSNGGST